MKHIYLKGIDHCRAESSIWTANLMNSIEAFKKRPHVAVFLVRSFDPPTNRVNHVPIFQDKNAQILLFSHTSVLRYVSTNLNSYDYGECLCPCPLTSGFKLGTKIPLAAPGTPIDCDPSAAGFSPASSAQIPRARWIIQIIWCVKKNRYHNTIGIHRVSQETLAYHETKQ